MSEPEVNVTKSKNKNATTVKQVGIGIAALLVIVVMFATRHNSKEQVKEALAETKGPVTDPTFQAKLDKFKRNEVFDVSNDSQQLQPPSGQGVANDQINSLISKIKNGVSKPDENKTNSFEDFMEQEKQQLYQSYSQSKSQIHDFTSDDVITFGGNSSLATKQIPMGSVIDVIVRSKANNHYLGSNWFGVVANDIYSADRSEILINKGAAVNGQIVSVGSANPIIETRIALNVEKIKRSDGSLVVFDQMASDSEGIGAISGDVNKHSFAKWGGFSAFALLGNGLSLSTNTEREAQSSQDLALRDITSNVSSATNQAASEYLSIKPTVTLRSGDLISVMIANDVNVTPMSDKRRLL
ncbi:MAG: TrbI/VirB10 family protein [Marinicella sp.]